MSISKNNQSFQDALTGSLFGGQGHESTPVSEEQAKTSKTNDGFSGLDMSFSDNGGKIGQTFNVDYDVVCKMKILMKKFKAPTNSLFMSKLIREFYKGVTGSDAINAEDAALIKGDVPDKVAGWLKNHVK